MLIRGDAVKIELMSKSVAVIGAGVSGLTSAIVLAEQGHRVTILAAETGQRTTSAVAAAIWFPYDAKPAEKVVPWALTSFEILKELAQEPGTGVSMIEQRIYSRMPGIEIPDWARDLGAVELPALPGLFASGFKVIVPLTDTTIYLDYLERRFSAASGELLGDTRIKNFEAIDRSFEAIVNCSGIGARELAQDRDLEPHRGQVASVAKMEMDYAVVCDDEPLMYVIPRSRDCIFGGTNTVSDDRTPDPQTTAMITAECSRTLNIETPKVLAERVGLRPFRTSGVRVERGSLTDGRPIVHNYGHGGAGFTLSWGCALEVAKLLG